MSADLRFRRHYEDILGTWQARALERSTDKMHRVVQSVLAHSYPDHVETLFKVVYPGFRSITLPFFCSAGSIALNGNVCADLADKHGIVRRNTLVFKDETEMTKAFRELADDLKLSDRDRLELFKCAKAWIVCDYRQPVSGPELEDYIARRTQ